jgi:hypothetical protein
MRSGDYIANQTLAPGTLVLNIIAVIGATSSPQTRPYPPLKQ